MSETGGEDQMTGFLRCWNKHVMTAAGMWEPVKTNTVDMGWNVPYFGDALPPPSNLLFENGIIPSAGSRSSWCNLSCLGQEVHKMIYIYIYIYSWYKQQSVKVTYFVPTCVSYFVPAYVPNAMPKIEMTKFWEACNVIPKTWKTKLRNM